MYALQLFIVKLADAYTTILLVYVLMSWIPNRSGILADIETVLGKVCDPYLTILGALDCRHSLAAAARICSLGRKASCRLCDSYRRPPWVSGVYTE